MYKTLIILVLAAIVLGWNFIFSSEKKIDLTDQAKVLQGVSLALKYKVAVIKHWNENSELPDKNAVSNKLKLPPIDTSKSLVQSISVSEQVPGEIVITFQNKNNIRVEKDINGKIIRLSPAIVNDKLDWSCRGDLDKELLPKRCQSLK